MKEFRDPSNDAAPPPAVSRTQQKKAAAALQKLGERLVGLSDAQLAAIALGEDLLNAVLAARRMQSHAARRRQLQYIGGLMRRIDATPIAMQLERIDQGHSHAVRRFKQVERWRDELLAGDQARLEWLLATYPALKPDELTALVREAADLHRPAALRRKQARALFRYLNRHAAET